MALRQRITDATTRDSADVGIGVGAASVRVVLLRRGAVAWYDERSVSDERPLEEALSELFAQLPTSRWGRLSAVAAVGPARLHLRRILDLPAGANVRMLTSIVREDLGRYFVQGPAPLVVMNACRRADNVWAGAIEQPVVTALVNACGRHAITLRAVVPFVSLVGCLAEDGTVQTPDGDVVGLTEFAGGEIASYRRVPRGVPELLPASAVPTPVIPGMTEDAVAFADAWLAAKVGGRQRLSHRLSVESNAMFPHQQRRRLAIAAAALVTCVGGSTGVRLLRARSLEREAARTVLALQSRAREAARDERALVVAAHTLRTYAAFGAARSMTLTLAALTDAISAPTSLLSLQTDSGSATLVAVTPSAATLMDELSGVPGVVAPAIVGSVTPVAPMTGVVPGPFAPPGMAPPIPAPADTSEPMQRVTIRLSWRRDVGPVGSAPTAGGSVR